MAQTSSQGAAESSDPRFAQRAAELLASGDADGAIDIAFLGTDTFPWYGTGHYILGMCYETAGRLEEAAAAYGRAAEIVPDSPVIADALQRIGGNPEPDNSVVPQEEEGGQQYTEDAAEEPAEPSAMDDLELQLRSAGKIVPDQNFEPQQDLSESTEDDPTKLVSKTLAEIYVQQEQYGEAIRAYRALIDENPAHEEEFRKRIEEIEEMIRRQLFG